MSSFMPKHTVIDRSEYSFVGNIPNMGVFVRSGTIDNVTGSTTGSATINFDAIALRLRRAGVFHSGVADFFNVKIENSTPNTGSFFDSRDVVVCYNNVVKSVTSSSATGISMLTDLLMPVSPTNPYVGLQVLLKYDTAI